MQPYNPFKDIDKQYLCSEIKIRSTASNQVALNEFILHKSIGKGSYAQVRSAFDLVSQQPVAMRFVNRKNLSKKIGLEKADAMVVNSTKIHLLLKKSLDLYQLIYSPKFFQSFDDKILIPVSHQLYDNFTSEFTIQGNLTPIEQNESPASLRSNTPRFSNEFIYDNCSIQVLQLANRGSMLNLQAGDLQLKQLLLQVAEQICEMHQKRIIHCDLKSDNILLMDQDDVLIAKLSDFDTSIILEDTYLRIEKIQNILDKNEFEGLNFIIVDSYQADFIGEIVSTPAISAPETRNCASAFMGVETDIWQFGQLLLQQFCGANKNISVGRNSKEFEIIEYYYSYDLADLIAGLTEINPALRYDMNLVVEHSFFKNTVSDISQFHSLVSNFKAKKVIYSSKDILLTGELVEYANTQQQYEFLLFLEAMIIQDIKPLFIGQKEQFSLRQNQNEKFYDIFNLFMSILNQLKREIFQIKRSESARYKTKKIQYNSKFYQLDYIYKFLTPEICLFFNQNKILIRQITCISSVDVRDLQTFPRHCLYKACQGIQYLNILTRLIQFNMYRCYYQSDHQYTPQTIYQTFELDVERRKAQLTRAELNPINLPKLNVQQSIYNIQAIMRDQLEEKSVSSKAHFEASSDDLEDLPCKFTPAVTEQFQAKMPKLNMQLNLPTLNFPVFVKQLEEVEDPKPTYEHRTNINSQEIESIIPEEYTDTSSIDSSDNPNFVEIKQVLSGQNLLSKQNNSSLRRSTHEKFEPIDWQVLQSSMLPTIKEENLYNSKSQNALILQETSSKTDKNQLQEADEDPGLEELYKLTTLFAVTIVTEIEELDIDIDQYDIGECSSGSI
ncbi:Kinase, CAMKK [Spironucleus salmonicida]|uniref:Kinase, CAMKK n=1 Tax=Spironucleus salmonicida TaxID=348837 RepID=V6LS16_9EUKA|nr:Kinase, CAMKK [Spironucleus salmonicida]|eukprot:EST47452.1 Kinase, CAMKK [Spironucleus salmonicida]